MDKEECAKRCEQLICSAPQPLTAGSIDEGEIAIHSWSTEVVCFISGILPKDHLVCKHLDRDLKNKLPSNKLTNVLGTIKGFKASLDAGDLDYLFVASIGFSV